MSQNEIANRCGVSQSNYSKYENGVVEPSYSFLTKLVGSLGVHADWLLVGQGEMFEEQDGHAPCASSNNSPTHLLVDKAGQHLQPTGHLVEMPVAGIVAAGAPQEQTGEHGGLPPVRISLHNPDNYLVLMVKGKSMAPRLLDEDVILVRRETDWMQCHRRICAVAVDDDGYSLKELVLDASSRLVVLRSINDDYRPIIVNPEDTPVRLIGVLSWIFHSCE
ncbi:MAG: XRE family transcriptional regulator [Candidatus Cloacimonetes bacterium]|nr:XRE family transcriptional regulator [Candidatus Cloacimonadota bacterium]